MNTPRYRCLIVDDEPIARKILLNYIGQMPNLICVAECKNAFDALTHLQADKTIDIVFLDINLPNMSGTTMPKMLTRPVQVIFSTAYSEFAVESYNLNAADYLLKPYLFERFAEAVYKAIDRLTMLQLSTMPTPAVAPAFIYLKSNGETFKVNAAEILYCEALKNYTKVVLNDGKYHYPLSPISKLETQLNEIHPGFLRAHRSFLIAKSFIQSVGANYVMVDQFKIPIGLQYKNALLQQIGMEPVH